MQPLRPLHVPLNGVRLVEASAGTGKTYTIASLYLRLLLEERRSVTDILVVTYTVAATEELRGRLRARLREALQVLQGATTKDLLLREQVDRLPDRAGAITRLTEQLACIDQAAIFTIHGFCQRMLQENAFESGTLFDVELLEDDRELTASVVEDFWRRAFHGADTGLAALVAGRFGGPAGLEHVIRPYVTRADLEIRPRVAPEEVSHEAFTRHYAQARDLWRDHRVAVIDLLNGCKDLKRGPYKPAQVEEEAAAADAWFDGPPDGSHVPPCIAFFATSTLDNSITDAKREKGIRAPSHPFFAACDQLADLPERRTIALLQEAIVRVREERARRKADRGQLAFDDLLSQLRAALEADQGATLAQRIAGRFPVALIDEFQDTDPEQYRIFASIYRDTPGATLFMIGDPKQAIYSFRGADIFTYMGAKADTAPEARYTLDTNWRSTGTLVAAINTLFQQAEAPFLFPGHIDFHPVQASGKADATPLAIEGDADAPLRFWFVEADGENATRQGVIKTGWLDRWLPEFCAEEMVRLLNLGARGKAHIGTEPLQPRHMAVLVRDRYEAAAVQQALRARRVNSVYYGRDSVYESEEAEELERVLLAIADPARETTLRAALCTLLWGIDGNTLARLQQDEAAWEDLVAQVQGYQNTWIEHGFMPMFRAWLQEFGVAPRLLALEDGERRMTNLLQLAELLQQASRDHPGIERLLRWFAAERAQPNGDVDEQQLRLESDDDLVKIVTVHKSKGLEYPIVFLPFAWDAKPRKKAEPVLFHDPATRGPVVDLAACPESYALAERERLAEDLRLLYVAITRAQYRCYLPWGKFRNGELGALAWLLHGSADFSTVDKLAAHVGGLDEAALRERLSALGSCSPPRVTAQLFTPRRSDATTVHAPEPPRPVHSDWRVTSYTGLSAAAHGERPDYGSAKEDAEAPAVAPTRLSLLDFPRGSRAGTFMHHVLEQIDFPEARGEALRQIIAKALARSGYGTEWLPAVEEMVGNTLDTALAPGVRLRDVAPARCLVELEFHYPLRQLRAADLERTAAGLAAYDPASPSLHFGTVNGIMRGFIDLVFESGGRFYIVDYKSNFLGPRREDYAPDALRAAVAANRYDLQYLIYSVALHRYLSGRLPAYDYERHFGGVFYLFLRGMDPQRPGLGVHVDRPPLSQVAALDRLFRGATP